ncbi:MAG: hypothetical protein EPO13_08005 [Actinomycetota bacterium]|nr:MAG: hypothetical protein EPO13_08005 [Actinomycetota bacterium]
MSILLDAGPTLNFIAVSEQALLLDLARAHGLCLAAPDAVRTEVDRNAGQGRFAATGAQRTWRTLVAAKRVEILDDTLVDEAFIAAVARVSGRPAADRVRSKRNLGEILVIAHGSVLAQQGNEVFVLIDDGDGQRRALRERTWLVTNAAPGSLTLWNTTRVLKHTAPDRWQALYRRMRAFDDGLPPL